MYNSEEFIKKSIWISQDGNSLRIYSSEICGHLESADARDEAFNEAIEYVSSINPEFEFDGYEENGNECVQNWVRK